jgi:solute carrier family 29 (equilibrative nucleoside transporter), member 1/2/3
MSLPSEGLYSPIPQSETSIFPESGPGIDAAPDHDNPPTSTGPLISGLVEKHIRWIHFILGCSVLLSWNGAI